jgi:ADP-ribose pyrophosphatase
MRANVAINTRVLELIRLVKPGDWVVESTRSLLLRQPWIEVLEEHIRLPDGRRVDDFYTVRLRDFVVIAPLTAEGELVAVTHYRHGFRGTVLSLPSGFIEPDETPAEAARRELIEETGFAADDWCELGTFVVDGNRGCGRAHVHLARGANRVAAPQTSDLAAISVELLSLGQAASRMWRGDMAELACASALALALVKINTESHSATRV